MTPNYLFGLTKKLSSYGCPIRSGWIMDTGGRDHPVTMGTPCFVIFAEKEDLGLSESIGKVAHRVALVPITLNNKINPRLILDNHANTNKLALRIGPETSFFEDHKEIKVDYLNVGKFNHALDFVKDTAGSFTLLIKGSKNSFSTDLLKVIEPMAVKHKLRIAGYKNAIGTHSLMENDEVLLALTVMDIRQCIPVFDPKHVDGIVINCTTIYTEHSIYKDRLVNSCEFTFGFSNYPQNIIELDGQKLKANTVSAKTVVETIKSHSGYYTDIGKNRFNKEKVNRK